MVERAFTPTPIEELDEATQAVAIRAMGLREQNNLIVNRIEQLGGDVELIHARFEHLVGSLVHLGVITEHAMWEIALDWEENLRPQLKNVLDAAGKRIAELNKQAREEAARPKLIVPGQH